MEQTKKRGRTSLNGQGTSITLRVRCEDELHKFYINAGPDVTRKVLREYKTKVENVKAKTV